MRVFFNNSYNKNIFLATVNSYQEASQVISNFLNKHNYHAYYWRWWREKKDWWCDVGSHTEFFIVKGADEYFLKGRK